MPESWSLPRLTGGRLVLANQLVVWYFLKRDGERAPPRFFPRFVPTLNPPRPRP